MKSVTFSEGGVIPTTDIATPKYVEDIVQPKNPENQKKGAPDFTLTDNNGNKLSLSDLRGKTVLLDFGVLGVNHVLHQYPH